MYIITYVYDILVLPKFFGNMVILAETFGDIVISRPLLGGHRESYRLQNRLQIL